jgi:hypothetical protein
MPGYIRKHFSGPENLTRVQDADLLRACRVIGLLSEVRFTHVDLIRYMRNHASAAHPNQVELTGLRLASWLDTCIRHVITLPQDPITAHTGRLLGNIRRERRDGRGVRLVRCRRVAQASDLGDVSDNPHRARLLGRHDWRAVEMPDHDKCAECTRCGKRDWRRLLRPVSGGWHGGDMPPGA